jgi:hypothetical protein
MRLNSHRDPYFIFNIDETDSVTIEHTKLEHITLMFGIPMKGEAMKLLAILPRLTMPPLPQDLTEASDNSGTDSGWITGNLLVNWIEGPLVDHINHLRIKRNYQGNALITLDNHISRDYIDFIGMSARHKIDFLRLPPHSSAAMQSLDRCPNGEFKKFFTKAYKSDPNDDATDRRIRILRATRSCIDTSLSSYYAGKGWEESGLFPLLPLKVLNKLDVIDDIPNRQDMLQMEFPE